MNNPQFSGPDAVRSRLRAAMSTLEREIAKLSAPAADATASSQSAILSAFNALTKELALGPDPEIRACPKCKHFGMLAATRCGNCWTALTPPTEAATA